MPTVTVPPTLEHVPMIAPTGGVSVVTSGKFGGGGGGVRCVAKRSL